MDLIKELVSQDKWRYKDANFNLDLTYITNNLIAMGFPASGVEGYFRNHIDDIAQYLKWRHNDKFLVLNLSAEKSYDPQLFQYKALHLGFPDHHSPPLLLLFQILLHMDNYLKEDDERVVAVHCLAGRGRTGTVISSYLVFSGEIETITDALELYARRRSSTLKGVSQPSQRRYAGYMDYIGIHGLYPKPRSLRLLKVKMGPVPQVSSRGGIRPMLYVYNYSEGTEEVLFTTENTYKAKYFPPTTRVFSVSTRARERPVIFTGDIVFKLFHIHSFAQLGTQYIELARLIFHTGMEYHVQAKKSSATPKVPDLPTHQEKLSPRTPTTTAMSTTPTTTSPSTTPQAPESPKEINKSSSSEENKESSAPEAKPDKIRDSSWGSNLELTDLSLQPESSSPPMHHREERKGPSPDTKPQGGEQIVYTFPLSGLDDAYKDPRFSKEFFIQFYFEEVSYKPKTFPKRNMYTKNAFTDGHFVDVNKPQPPEADWDVEGETGDAYWNEDLYQCFYDRFKENRLNSQKIQQEKQTKLLIQWQQQLEEEKLQQSETTTTTTTTIEEPDTESQFLLLPIDKINTNVERAAHPSRRTSARTTTQVKHRGVNNL